MNRITKLYSYLIKNNHFFEADYIYKIAAAIDEKKYKEDYPQIYSVWSSTFHTHNTPWHGFANIIKQLEENNIELDKSRPYSYEELTKVLSDIKQQRKQQDIDEILEYLNKNLDQNQIPSEEDLNLAKQKGLSKEEILYLINDKQSHRWDEKVDMTNKFNSSKIALPEEDRDKTILDFANIDDAVNFLYSYLNTAPKDLEEFYKGIEQKALATSDVVYNSNNYIVVHSKSMEAAQYWEQSCVTVDKEGKVTAGTCTSRINDNYFDLYDKWIYSFQIITKEYPTQIQTPRTSFKDKNKMFNFVSLSINKTHGLIQWGAPDTVNRQNKSVLPCDLVFILGDEYDTIINEIKTYCKKFYSLDVKDFFLADGEKCKKHLESPNSFTNEELSFFGLSLDESYPEYIENHLKEISPESYFEDGVDEKYGEKYPDVLKDKLLGISKSKEYFVYKLDEKYGEKYPDVLEHHLKNVSYEFYFSDGFKLDEKYGQKYSKILIDKLKESFADPKDYEKNFEYSYYIDNELYRKYPDISEQYFHQFFINDISLEEFLEQGLQYVFPNLLYDKLRALSPSTYYRFDKGYEHFDNYNLKDYADYPSGVSYLEYNDEDLNPEHINPYEVSTAYQTPYRRLLKRNSNFDDFQSMIDHYGLVNFINNNIDKGIYDEQKIKILFKVFKGISFFTNNLDIMFGERYPDVLKEKLLALECKQNEGLFYRDWGGGNDEFIILDRWAEKYPNIIKQKLEDLKNKEKGICDFFASGVQDWLDKNEYKFDKHPDIQEYIIKLLQEYSSGAKALEILDCFGDGGMDYYDFFNQDLDKAFGSRTQEKINQGVFDSILASERETIDAATELLTFEFENRDKYLYQEYPEEAIRIFSAVSPKDYLDSVEMIAKEAFPELTKKKLNDFINQSVVISQEEYIKKRKETEHLVNSATEMGSKERKRIWDEFYRKYIQEDYLSDTKEEHQHILDKLESQTNLPNEEETFSEEN